MADGDEGGVEMTGAARGLLGTFGGLAGCWLVMGFALLYAVPLGSPLLAPIILALAPVWWLALFGLMVFAYPGWILPGVLIGFAVSWTVTLLLARRGRLALGLVAGCVAFHVTTCAVVEITLQVGLRQAAAQVPGDRLYYYQRGALDMLRNGMKEGVRHDHAVLETTQGWYHWSFVQDAFVPSDEGVAPPP